MALRMASLFGSTPGRFPRRFAGTPDPACRNRLPP
uniref:Uncharacterized protein n=1 Tax=Anguilla anguilla TaxID=7936 RepID=A0A0E9Q2R2_ANGAN